MASADTVDTAPVRASSFAAGSAEPAAPGSLGALSPTWWEPEDGSEPEPWLTADEAFERFFEWCAERGIELWPHQEEALMDLAAGNHVILGTPTGSTAYNISVGGSVVYPHCKNILLTPVAAHSLTQRPLIVDSGVKLEFGVRERALLIIDGQESIDILPQDRILIQQSPQDAHLIYPKERNYFEILREKFKWGEL